MGLLKSNHLANCCPKSQNPLFVFDDVRYHTSHVHEIHVLCGFLAHFNGILGFLFHNVSSTSNSFPSHHGPTSHTSVLLHTHALSTPSYLYDFPNNVLLTCNVLARIIQYLQTTYTLTNPQERASRMQVRMPRSRSSRGPRDAEVPVADAVS